MALSVHQAYNHKEAAIYRLPPFPLTPKGHQSGQETNRAALNFRKARECRGGEQRSA
jgi:hypothetical protein